MSATSCTKDRLTASRRCSAAKASISRSRSVKALMPRSMPGRFMPLRERSSPPANTRQWTSSPLTCSTSSPMKPSLRKIRSPGLTTFGSAAKLVETRPALPTSSPACSTKACPVSSWIGSLSSMPTRSFGPGRSPMMATRRPEAADAARTLAIVWRWNSKSPCAKLMRATFMPCPISPSSTSADCDAGPMVQTILVFFSAMRGDVTVRRSSQWQAQRPARLSESAGQ